MNYISKKTKLKLFCDFDFGMFFNPKMQPPKIAFINQIEPSINTYQQFKFWEIFRWNTHWSDGFLDSAKDFKERYKSEIIGKITNDFFVKMIKKSQFLSKKLKKMQPPTMNFRSQIEPSIKNYECFMFLRNFRSEITLDWCILERPQSFFSFKNREIVKLHSIIRHPISP